MHFFLEEFHPQNYLNDKCFPLQFFCFLRMKVDITFILAGCIDVVQYKRIKKMTSKHSALARI